MIAQDGRSSDKRSQLPLKTGLEQLELLRPFGEAAARVAPPAKMAALRMAAALPVHIWMFAAPKTAPHRRRSFTRSAGKKKMEIFCKLSNQGS